MQTLILAPQTGVFSGQIRTGRRDRRLRIGAPRRSRPHPLIPIPPGAQPRRGNPQILSNLAQRPAAARQQPHRLRLELIRVLATQCTHQTPSRSQRSLSEVSTISREGQCSLYSAVPILLGSASATPQSWASKASLARVPLITLYLFRLAAGAFGAFS